jgi:seryl-tRNA synthetase
MLDIRFIRENAERVQLSAEQKGYTVSIAKLLQCDDARRELQQQVDELRERRNQNASKMKGGCRDGIHDPTQESAKCCAC